MQRSVGERVQGTAPEREAEMDRRGTRRKQAEDGGERWRNDRRCEDGRQRQTQRETDQSLGRGRLKLHMTEERAASVSIHSIQDCVNVESVANRRSSANAKTVRSDRAAVHVRKNTQATIRSQEKLEDARLKRVMLEMLLESRQRDSEGQEMLSVAAIIL